jgi:hypothetical protein
MDYMELIKSSYVNEEQMWDAIECVSSLLEKLRESHPEEVKELMISQYEAMNGKHINEWLAKKLVSNMWHTAADGKSEVYGELVSSSDAAQMIADWPSEKQIDWRWDAYVAANAFAHDLATVGMSKPDLMKAAKAFWLHDEDMPEGNKVYWYFKEKIFG